VLEVQHKYLALPKPAPLNLSDIQLKQPEIFFNCKKPTTMFLLKELDMHHKVHHFIKKMMDVQQL